LPRASLETRSLRLPALAAGVVTATAAAQAAPIGIIAGEHFDGDVARQIVAATSPSTAF